MIIRHLRRFYKKNLKLMDTQLFTKEELVFVREFIVENKFEPRKTFRFRSYNKEYREWIFKVTAFKKLLMYYLENHKEELAMKFEENYKEKAAKDYVGYLDSLYARAKG